MLISKVVMDSHHPNMEVMVHLNRHMDMDNTLVNSSRDIRVRRQVSYIGRAVLILSCFSCLHLSIGDGIEWKHFSVVSSVSRISYISYNS